MTATLSLKTMLQWCRSGAAGRHLPKISSAFFLAGILWVLLSNIALSMFVHAATATIAVEIGKGWLFVIAATAVITVLELRNARILAERERLQARSLERERRFRLITENSRDLISLCDEDGRYVYLSPSFTEVLGFTAEELMQTRSGDLLHPDDRDVFAHCDHVARAEYRRRSVRGWVWLEGRRSVVTWQARRYIVDIARDITDRKDLERQVAEYTRRLERLSKRLVEVQEVERRHLARELHDEIGQSLTAVKITLEGVKRGQQDAATIARLEDSIANVGMVLDHVRSLSLDLRPAMLDALGLAPALRTYVDQHARRAGIGHEFIAESIRQRFPEAIEIACFRVAQEALNNVVKHARAQHVRVELAVADAVLSLAVIDDGQGFDAEARSRSAAGGASFGLLGMRERVLLAGGRFDLMSRHGAGTVVRARFPLAAEAETETEIDTNAGYGRLQHRL